MSKNVLIVDDAIFMRIKLKHILEENGYSVVGEAENGQEAIEIYKRENPDIVLMDITMPGMDGVDSLKGIIDYDEDAKVIMCSAMGQQNMVMEAIKSGAIDFIVKPFDNDRVIDALEKVK